MEISPLVNAEGDLGIQFKYMSIFMESVHLSYDPHTNDADNFHYIRKRYYS